VSAKATIVQPIPFIIFSGADNDSLSILTLKSYNRRRLAAVFPKLQFLPRAEIHLGNINAKYFH
jgi:hypothetical protein